jgi:hypothetical protein
MPAVKNSSNTNAVVTGLMPSDDEVAEAVKAANLADLAKAGQGEQAVQEQPKDQPAQG